MTDYTEPAMSGTLANDDTQVLGIVGVLGGSRTSNTLYAKGTWGGATLSIEITPDGTTWYPFADTLTDDNFFNFGSRFMQARLSVSGGGGTTEIDWQVL